MVPCSDISPFIYHGHLKTDRSGMLVLIGTLQLEPIYVVILPHIGEASERPSAPYLFGDRSHLLNLNDLDLLKKCK